MRFYRHYLLCSVAWTLAALLLVGAAVKVRAMVSGPDLWVEWDGFGGRINYRDIGASLNSCLSGMGRPKLLKEDRVGRSNHKFSGFSCGRVGQPEVIYSLNHDPNHPRHYFCVGEEGPVIGRAFNEKVELNDLEFAKTWDDPIMRADACAFFRDSFASIAAGRRTLIHCEAGRDRTGAYAALLQALVAELADRLDDAMLAAIECDYRATRSLKPYKFGRMKSFISDLMQRGGVTTFLSATCGIEPATLRQLTDSLLWEASP